MKFANKHISFIYEGLRVLHETGLDRDGFVFGPHLNWSDLSPIEGDMDWDSTFPLHVVLEIRPADFQFTLKKFRKAIEVSLTHLISIHCPTLFSVLARDPSESYDALIRRFNDARSFSRGEFLNPHNPEHVGRRGLKLIEDADLCITSVPQIAWGVALIGWSSLIIGTTVECAFCPRRSAPGSKYCFEHSQSDCDKSNRFRTPAEQYTKYRIGKKARQIANKNGWLVKGPKRKRCTFPMFEILKPEITFEAPKSPLFNLRAYLEDCPRVISRLGGDSILSLDYTTLIEVIRAKLNPFEQDHGVYAITVLQFEKWFELEDLVKQRMRSRGVKASKRVREAISMAKEGATKTEIARKLGVGQSTVSSWIKKHESLRLAFAPSVGSDVVQALKAVTEVSQQQESVPSAPSLEANFDWKNSKNPLHIEPIDLSSGPYAGYTLSFGDRFEWYFCKK